MQPVLLLWAKTRLHKYWANQAFTQIQLFVGVSTEMLKSAARCLTPMQSSQSSNFCKLLFSLVSWFFYYYYYHYCFRFIIITNILIFFYFYLFFLLLFLWWLIIIIIVIIIIISDCHNYNHLCVCRFVSCELPSLHIYISHVPVVTCSNISPDKLY